MQSEKCLNAENIKMLTSDSSAYLDSCHQEIRERGKLNAGILDTELSPQWVRSYINLFDGNPKEVTISRESAGGGSVMLMSMLRGSRLGDSLFKCESL